MVPREGHQILLRGVGTGLELDIGHRSDELKRTEHELHALKEQFHRENAALRDEISQASMFAEIVGSSAALRRVLMLVGKVAGVAASRDEVSP